MRLLCLLVLIASPAAVAAGPTPAAPAPAEAAAPPRESFDTPLTIQASTGLTLSANLRDEYLAGLPILVEVRAGNTGAAALTTPDLSKRTHLVHFLLTSPAGKQSERYSTPPAFETGGDWSIAPKGERAVLLEVPSSAALEPGNWRLQVIVGDGATAVRLPEVKFAVSPPKPVAGDLLWEPTIERSSGALVPWVHRAANGWDVYSTVPRSPTPSSPTTGSSAAARPSTRSCRGRRRTPRARAGSTGREEPANCARFDSKVGASPVRSARWDSPGPPPCPWRAG
jgi:hypothetical protein